MLLVKVPDVYAAVEPNNVPLVLASYHAKEAPASPEAVSDTVLPEHTKRSPVTVGSAGCASALENEKQTIEKSTAVSRAT